MKKVNAYTDGACLGNPGPGGYGVILEYKGKTKEMAEGFALATNNRMELSAVIRALSELRQSCDVTVYSDSRYVVDAVTKRWLFSWESKGWKKADGSPALNVDLWEKLLLLLGRHKVKLVWVKGHDGHPQNERCDQLASDAAKKAAETAKKK